MNDIENISQKDTKICLVICCFLSKRLRIFLEKLNQYSLGISCDIVFVHNKTEPKNIINRYKRSLLEISEVRNLINSFDYYGNKIIVERDNIGEDMGAYHYIFNILKDQYDYFYFVNEAASINSNNWLKLFHIAYTFSDKVVAVSPQVCPSTTHPFCLTSTFWSLKSSFGKLMIWPKPMSRKDCEDQEMSLVYPQVCDKGLKIAQAGSGTTFLSYKNTHYMKEGVYP